MKTNLHKLESIINELVSDLGRTPEYGYPCTETSVLIGDIDGKPIQITVFSDFDEAGHSDNGVLEKFKCIEE